MTVAALVQRRHHHAGSIRRSRPTGGELSDPSSEQPGIRVVRPPGDDPASRRRFIRLVSLAGGAVALSSLIAACGENDPAPPSAEGELAPADRDLTIVNYALFLEYLEEQFYDAINQSNAIEDRQLARLLRSVGANETQHARALEELASQLGGTPVDRPQTNFREVISGGEQSILETAAEIENLGASAYLGQAPLIKNPFLLEAALAIHSVEARHSAALNELAGFGFRTDQELRGSIPDGAFAEPRTEEEVLRVATDFVRV